MKVVIDISENQYEIVKEYIETVDDENLLANAIVNGTPLPKGHGRLIDADELFLDIQTDEQMRLGEHLAWVKERIDSAPTIIEAESEVGK